MNVLLDTEKKEDSVLPVPTDAKNVPTPHTVSYVLTKQVETQTVLVHVHKKHS